MASKKNNLAVNCLKISLNLGFLAFLLVYIVGLGRGGVVRAETDQEVLADNPQPAADSVQPVENTKKLSDDKKISPDKVVRAVITAYTSTPEETDGDPFTAASGKRVYDGMIAANWLPFGTKIKIPSLYGDKIFTVDDRMNSRYGYGRLDIWFDSGKGRTEAKNFGVKRVDVEVYYADGQLAKN